MNRFFLCGCVLFCSLHLTLYAYALTFVDNMTDLGSNSIKSYTNMAPVSGSPIPPVVQNAIQGKNAFTFASSRPVAAAEYRVQGADTVSVGIYTLKGTFVTYVEADAAYALGVYCDNIKSAVSGKTLGQAQISLNDYSLYYRNGAQLYKLQDTGPYFAFLPTTDSAANLVDYGVNVYAGVSADQLTRVSLPSGGSQSRISAMNPSWFNGYCYEELAYALPSGTRYVRVEINDYAYINKVYPNGQTVQMPPATGMRCVLSSVTFSGSNLVLGIPEPAVPEGSASSGSAADKEEKSTSSGRRSSQESESPAYSGSSSRSSSKFQGEITSPDSGSTASSRRGASSAAPEPTNPDTASADTAPTEKQSSLMQVFRVEPGDSGGAAWGIVAYIVVVCGLVLILLLRGKGG